MTATTYPSSSCPATVDAFPDIATLIPAAEGRPERTVILERELRRV